MSPDPVDTSEATPHDLKVLRLARFTVPTHALLPLVIWQIGRHSEAAAIWFVLGLHGLFLVAILASFRWWRGYGEQLGMLILLDHLATFVAGGALASWLG